MHSPDGSPRTGEFIGRDKGLGLTVGIGGVEGMGILLVKCPVTGKDFSTGVQVEAASAIDTLPDIPLWARCPYCHREHPWTPTNAYFSKAIPPADSNHE
jgi:hypothetical protein